MLDVENREKHDGRHRIQLHLVMPYKLEAREQHQIKAYLDEGYRILQLQRITDREVIVTLTNEPADGAG